MNMKRGELIQEACKSTGTAFGSTFYAEMERCPQAATLRYRHGVVPSIADPAQLVGSLVHAVLGYAGLRVLYGMCPDKHGWHDVLDAYVERLDDYDPIVMAQATTLLQGYWAQWGHDNAGYPADATLLDVEKPMELWIDADGAAFLEAPEHAAIQITGTIDAVLESSQGDVVIVDHKTRASLPADAAATHPQKAARRPQYLAMCAYARLVTGLAPYFVDNVLVKTRTPKYARFSFQASDELITAWARHLFRTRAAYERDPDRMCFSACAPGIGKPCWAFDYCHSKSDDERNNKYTTVAVAQPDLPVTRLRETKP